MSTSDHTFGLVNLNKPPGMTSRRALDVVARLVRPAKAGHAGTLDPLASGVLMICVGQATRLIEYLQAMRKTYRATFLLGRESPTEDVEGEVTLLPDSPIPSRESLNVAIPEFIGEIQQRPPAFSALKVGGRRAYDLARAGAAPELAPRTISIERIEVLGYEYPELRLEIECGSGSYIRSLGRDIAVRLGTAAVMSALTRTAIGRFRVEDAVDPAGLSATTLPGALQPALLAVEHMPRIEVTDSELLRISNGLSIEDRARAATGEIAAVDVTGRLIAILARRSAGDLGPSRYFSL